MLLFLPAIATEAGGRAILGLLQPGICRRSLENIRRHMHKEVVVASLEIGTAELVSFRRADISET